MCVSTSCSFSILSLVGWKKSLVLWCQKHIPKLWIGVGLLTSPVPLYLSSILFSIKQVMPLGLFVLCKRDTTIILNYVLLSLTHKSSMNCLQGHKADIPIKYKNSLKEFLPSALFLTRQWRQYIPLMPPQGIKGFY